MVEVINGRSEKSVRKRRAVIRQRIPTCKASAEEKALREAAVLLH